MSNPTAREQRVGAENLAMMLRRRLDALPAGDPQRPPLLERIERLDRIAANARTRDVTEALSELPPDRHRADVDG